MQGPRRGGVHQQRTTTITWWCGHDGTLVSRIPILALLSVVLILILIIILVVPSDDTFDNTVLIKKSRDHSKNVRLPVVSSFVRVTPTTERFKSHIQQRHHHTSFQPASVTALRSTSSTFLLSSRENTALLLPPTTTTTLVMEECIDWIDRYCDRIFLHAVIASDYHFLYRGISTATATTTTTTLATDIVLVDAPHAATTPARQLSLPSPLPTMQHDMTDLLQVETYGRDGLEFFQKIEQVLLEPESMMVRPSVGHLGTTIPIDAARWGEYAASIWPASLSSSSLGHRPAHPDPAVAGTPNSYAWFCDGGLFYDPTPNPPGNPPPPSIRNGRRRTNDEIRQSMVVVSGDRGSYPRHYHRSCRNDNLVDALLDKNGCEIMFTAGPYLAVPSIYDQLLRHHLRQSFLI